MERIKPARLRAVALHYRDLVCLPGDEKGLVQLEDYVRIFPQVPEGAFGPMASFSYDFRFLVNLPGLPGQSLGRLSVRTEPPDAARPGQLRQMMDWELGHDVLASQGAGDVIEWLDKAHAELLNRFRLAFTEEGWALFDPEDEET